MKDSLTATIGDENNLLAAIYNDVLQKKHANPVDSYSAKIFQDKKGINKILEKIIEEAGELLLAAKDQKKEDILNEMADLWFHNLLLLAHFRFAPAEVLQVLSDRRKKTFT